MTRRLTLIALALLATASNATAGTYTHRTTDGTVYRTTCHHNTYGLSCYDTTSPGVYVGNSAKILSALPADLTRAPDTWADKCTTSCAKDR